MLSGTGEFIGNAFCAAVLIPALRRAGPLFILSARLACCRGFSACGILACREAMRENRHTSELIYFVTQED